MTFRDWLNDQTDLPPVAESFDIGYLMARRGQAITIIRGASTTLAPQNVIVAPQSVRAQEVRGEAAISGRQPIIAIGWRDVSGKTDFDVQRGDRFMVNGTQYRVSYVDDTIPGRREATAEATQ